jgi:hypothetical protein
VRFVWPLIVIALCVPAQAAAKTPIPGVVSPSGNIRCLYVPGRPAANLLCSIGAAAYASELQNRCMSRASLDWHGFELGATRKASTVCSGGILYDVDRQQPVYKALAYGNVWRRGPFTCSSRVTGITCASRAGHGLFLSRASWRLW